MKKIRKYYYAGNIVYPGLNTLDRSNNWMDVMAQQVMPTPQISSVLFPPQSWMTPIQKALANNYILNLGVTSKNNGISSIPATSSTEDIQDNNIGSALGNIFSQGVSSIGNTAFNNIMKGQSLTEGMAQDAASSVSGAVAGLAGNLVGKGINSLGGNSMLSRGIGQGIATGIGTIGGQALSNIVNGKAAFGGISDSIKAIKGIKNASNFSKAAGISNLAGIGGQIVGAGLLAAFGPSKEYGGKYGSITQGMDTAYDLVQSAVGFIPGWGLVASGAMALNKGLSNIFGSTSGMTKQDAILGSAFMPAPVKWLNMAGAKTTQNFGNQSWQNTERTNAFMQNAFGNLSERFDRARQEAGKTYGTFSQGARRSADRNLAFANNAWEQILAMADLDELQRIRSLYMTSINNQRYAQMIQGGWNPIYRGKLGMKILNNATNHNMGMRLLSAAALIDNKAMILSAQGGTKVPKLQTTWKTIEKSDNTRVEKPTIVKPIKYKTKSGEFFYTDPRTGKKHLIRLREAQVQLDNRTQRQKEERHKQAVQVRKQELMRKAEEQTAQVANAVLERTMPSYWVEKAIGEDLGTAGSLAVDLASPYVLGKGILLLGKTGQVLTTVPNIIKNKGFATVLNTPWNTTKIKWRGIGNNSYIELENSGEWLKPKMMESTYHGTGRKLYDAAIEYALNNGYRGIMSGENLLSAPKTYNIWKHYPNKILLLGTGSHSNAKMVLGSPFYKEVSTEKELLDATKNNVKAYREGPIIGLTEPSLRIYLRSKTGLLVKVPILKTALGISANDFKLQASLESDFKGKPAILSVPKTMRKADSDVAKMNEYHAANVLEYNQSTGNNVTSIPFRTDYNGRLVKVLPNEEFNIVVRNKNTNAPSGNELNIGGMYSKNDDTVYLRNTGNPSNNYHEFLHSSHYGETNPEVTLWRLLQLIDEDKVSKMTPQQKTYYISINETPVHLRLLGERMNINVGDPYPGDVLFDKMLNEHGIGGATYYMKRDTSKAKQLLWKAFNGTLFSGLAATTLYNTNK